MSKQFLDRDGLQTVVNNVKEAKEIAAGAMALAQAAMESGIVDEYSLDEVKTNKVWIDGKPIYRKVLDVGSLPNATRKYITYDVNVDNPFFLNGTAKNSSGNKLGMPSANAVNLANSVACGWDTANNRVWIETGNDLTAFSGYLILEYTKTN